MRWVFALLMFVATASAADQTQAMLARLSEEADAFRRIAPSLLGHETLEQKARKPVSRFRPRVGKDAKAPPPAVWQDRQIVSEYGFVSFTGETESLHELRRVLSVDQKPVADLKKTDSLARVITLKDDQRERELLKEFEKYGLVGAVTDFGPLIMLFTPREIEHFEFTLKGAQTLGVAGALIFKYTQIDGPEMLSIFDKDSKEKPRRMRVEGEVWVREDNYLPLRITISVGDGQAASTVREEASVDYASSSFGALVPSAINHKEVAGGQLRVQNTFLYSDFHKFGADAEIQFEPAK